jgi:hypothetical protein
MLFSGAWGKMIHKKNLKQKTSKHCPFKKARKNLIMRQIVFLILHLLIRVLPWSASGDNFRAKFFSFRFLKQHTVTLYVGHNHTTHLTKFLRFIISKNG